MGSGIIKGQTKGGWGAAPTPPIGKAAAQGYKVSCVLCAVHALFNGQAETAPPYRLEIDYPLNYFTPLCYTVYYDLGVDMSNIKKPLLSLGARGSIGESLTFTKRRGVDIAEKKPKLPYFLTLPVIYQRWLYQDYAYLWTQQSAATKRQYASSGVRHHLTGFQYWMKYQLTYLPDILAWWKLDDNLGPTTVDSSRNALTATIFGASPATGRINGCFSFDGLNDTIRSPLSPILHPPLPISIEFFFKCPDHIGGFANMWTTPIKRRWNISTTPADLLWRISQDGTVATHDDIVTAIPSWGTWHHVICQHDGVNKQIIFNGVLITAPALRPSIFIDPTVPLWLGSYDTGLSNPYDGLIDDFFYRNRMLDVSEAQRHMLRRWPQK